MAKNNNNAATEAVAALTKDYNAAVEEQKALLEDATDEAKAEVQKKVDKAKIALDAENAKNSTPLVDTEEELVKGKFLVSPTWKYRLAYNVGEEAEFPKLQALEMEEAGYFKIAK